MIESLIKCHLIDLVIDDYFIWRSAFILPTGIYIFLPELIPTSEHYVCISTFSRNTFRSVDVLVAAKPCTSGCVHTLRCYEYMCAIATRKWYANLSTVTILQEYWTTYERMCAKFLTLIQLAEWFWVFVSFFLNVFLRSASSVFVQILHCYFHFYMVLFCLVLYGFSEDFFVVVYVGNMCVCSLVCGSCLQFMSAVWICRSSTF